MDIGVVTIIVQLVFLEGILSIDNAAVLGAMVAHLPADKPIPWPGRLRGLADWSARTLGPQRQAALKVGLLGAYAGRALMLLLAELIIDVPWVRILGALYLMYLAVEHFGAMHGAHHAQHGGAAPRARGGFWSTVAAIELTDLAFSVDNVIAAVALSSQLWVVMSGVAIGMVLMRFAATIFSRMIAWEPALASGAYLLLLWIGAQLMIDHFLHIHLHEIAQFGVSAGLLGLTVLVARTPVLRRLLPLTRPFLALFAGVTWAVDTTRSALASPFRRKET